MPAFQKGQSRQNGRRALLGETIPAYHVARTVGEFIPASIIQPSYQPEDAIHLGKLVRRVPKPMYKTAVVTTEAIVHFFSQLGGKTYILHGPIEQG